MKANRKSGIRLTAGTAAAAVTITLAAGAMTGTAFAQETGAHGKYSTAAAYAPAGALEEPTPEEQENLREVAASIWTPELAAGWNMNSEVVTVLSQATGAILRCSEAYALVPRPPALFPGPSYLRQYWKQVRDYFLAVKDNRTYRACVVTAAANYRSAIEMASLGI